jgi:hypothetical protein
LKKSNGMAALLQSLAENGIFPLTRSLFWDTDIAALDWEVNAPFIVERILQRGTVEDFRIIVSQYGRERLRDIIKNLRYLDKKPMYFASVYFQIPLNEMRCYNIRQSTSLHWNY